MRHELELLRERVLVPDELGDVRCVVPPELMHPEAGEQRMRVVVSHHVEVLDGRLACVYEVARVDVLAQHEPAVDEVWPNLWAARPQSASLRCAMSPGR